jgi:hypothetical protein
MTPNLLHTPAAQALRDGQKVIAERARQLAAFKQAEDHQADIAWLGKQSWPRRLLFRVCVRTFETFFTDIITVALKREAIDQDAAEALVLIAVRRLFHGEVDK